jgi:hypothetical protein
MLFIDLQLFAAAPETFAAATNQSKVLLRKYLAEAALAPSGIFSLSMLTAAANWAAYCRILKAEEKPECPIRRPSQPARPPCTTNSPALTMPGSISTAML